MSYLLTFFLRLSSTLPLRANHRVGALLGWCCWIFPTRLKLNTQINLALCFPEQTAAQRQALARQSLIEAGKSIVETGWFWYRPRATLERVIDTSRVDNYFQSLPPDSNIVVVAPHFGAWEICTLVLSRLDRPLYLYRPPRTAALEPLLVAGRKRFGAELVPVTKGGLKQAFRAMRAGRPIGVLPDQEPNLESGVFSEFFNVPANTMTLLGRLLNKSGASVLCLAVERRPSGAGYIVHKIEPPTDISHTDPLRAAKALNETVEQCVAVNPAQYIWNYRRFRLMPDGTRRSYQRDDLQKLTCDSQ